jgi:16S rRNA (guanine1207-N2)-methyltransferase
MVELSKNVAPLSRRGRCAKVASMKSADELKRDIEFEAELRGGVKLRFRSTWGLFSPRGVDEGSALLLEHLEVREGDRALDLGCGYGALGLTIARLAPAGRVTMVDTDFVAVDYARRNAEANGLSSCEVMLSNGLSQVPSDRRFDLVVSNLPAKVGRELLFILLSDVRDRLDPGGRLVVVTVNGLRKFIRRNFEEVFGNYDKLKQGRSYTVALAVKR